MMLEENLRRAVRIIEERLYYVALASAPLCDDGPTTDEFSESGPIRNPHRRRIRYFTVDQELVYWNFFLDFGPLNLGQLLRFCSKLNDMLQDPRNAEDVICFYSGTTNANRANATFLICAWQVLYLSRTPEEAYRGFRTDSLEHWESQGALKEPTISSELSARSANSSAPPRCVIDGTGPIPQALEPFHDASPCACTFDLTVLDCLRGLAKARMYNFFDPSTFDLEEYEHYEKVENGDLNWIVSDRIMAFAGPQHRRQATPEGYCTLTPSDYIPYFKRKKVALVVRLNKRCYDEAEFRSEGIEHLDQYYLDGSCPNMKILRRVVEAFESVPPDRAFAVHCKAGLGRTGTCIGAFLMKHYKFTAAEVIGWMRICRPGCVIGPQQQFLQSIEQLMWHEGDVTKMKPQTKLITDGNSTDDKTSGEEGTELDFRSSAGQAEALLARRAQFGRGELDTPQVDQK